MLDSLFIIDLWTRQSYSIYREHELQFAVLKFQSMDYNSIDSIGINNNGNIVIITLNVAHENIISGIHN